MVLVWSRTHLGPENGGQLKTLCVDRDKTKLENRVCNRNALFHFFSIKARVYIVYIVALF